MEQKILDKLTKIKALVERGEQGERKAAEQALTHLLNKYNITIADLENEEQKNRFFTVPTVEYFVFNQLKVQMFYRRSIWSTTKRNRYCIEMTEVEFIEFSALFDFHRNQYKKDLKKINESFKSAYAHKHDMFWDGPRNEGDNATTTRSKEDRERTVGLMGLLEDASFRKAIA